MCQKNFIDILILKNLIMVCFALNIFLGISAQAQDIKSAQCTYANAPFKFDVTKFIAAEGKVIKPRRLDSDVTLDAVLPAKKQYVILYESKLAPELKQFILYSKGKKTCFDLFKHKLRVQNIATIRSSTSTTTVVRTKVKLRKDEKIYFVEPTYIKRINTAFDLYSNRAFNSVFLSIVAGRTEDTQERKHTLGIYSLGYLSRIASDLYWGPILSIGSLKAAPTTFNSQSFIFVGGAVEKKIFSIFEDGIDFGINTSFAFDHNFSYNFNIGISTKFNIFDYAVIGHFGPNFLKINSPQLHESFSGTLPTVTLMFSYD